MFKKPEKEITFKNTNDPVMAEMEDGNEETKKHVWKCYWCRSEKQLEVTRLWNCEKILNSSQDCGGNVKPDVALAWPEKAIYVWFDS